jgi:hypothetical protein
MKRKKGNVDSELQRIFEVAVAEEDERMDEIK